jgi:ABC-type transporter Mla maintaining outer membrane lipid asymmetry ATPase subunit MlaF
MNYIYCLIQAVEDSLKSVNLFHSGFGDKSVSKYSGGMKRRLSVAIALIGNPKVVYMDEPSTGLDSRSRNDLWNIIKRAKKDCTIILTSNHPSSSCICMHCLGHFSIFFFRKIRHRLSLISEENNSYKSYLQVLVASQFLEATTPLIITNAEAPTGLRKKSANHER